MAMLSALAEDERLRIIKRTHEGRKIAQAKGVCMGRKPKLTLQQMDEARRRIAKREESTRDLVKSYGVSVSTISRLTLLPQNFGSSLKGVGKTDFWVGLGSDRLGSSLS